MSISAGRGGQLVHDRQRHRRAGLTAGPRDKADTRTAQSCEQLTGTLCQLTKGSRKKLFFSGPATKRGGGDLGLDERYPSSLVRLRALQDPPDCNPL